MTADHGPVPPVGSVAAGGRGEEGDGHEELLRLLIAETQDHAIFTLDPSGTVVTWNAGGSRIKGYRPEEIIGRHFSVFYPADDVAAGKPERELEDAATRGRLEDEGWRTRKDGSRFWANVVITALRGEDGELRGYGTVTRDLTERREHELAISAGEALVRGILDASTEYSIIASDRAGMITIFNTGAERMLGYTAAEMIGHRTVTAIHDDAEISARGPGHGRAPGFEGLVSPSCLGSGETRDWTYVRADGGRLTVMVTVSRIPAEDASGAGFIFIARDVTDERATRAAKQTAEEQFRRSFEHALMGMMIFDLDGRYIEVNDAFCELVGHSRETLIGLSRERVTHPDDLAPDAAALQALLDGERTSYTREKRYIHAVGEPVWALTGVTLIHGVDGRPLHFIGQAQDITERRRYETQLRHLADHDPLSGLLNRRSFERELDSHVARGKRTGITGVVLMIDLDNFKYHNDTQGHGAGDTLIVRIAHRLRDRLREADVIARLGGDEFGVLLPHEDHESALIIAQSLLDNVREEAATLAIGDQKRVTASIGIACFDDARIMSADEIMVNADLAMYDAKEAGRNGVAFYRTEQHDRPRVQSHMKWATEITEALAHGRFELLAQPIQPLRHPGPSQYELLLRMRDLQGDLIPPGTFLYIAERLGMIQEIDRWVADRAITMLAEQINSGHDLRLEVNLSGHTMGDSALLDLIEVRLAESGVPPDRLIFEITETAAIANIARAADFAGHLSALGCKFALDDFGAGFGSFYYLKHLPFDYLKIDGEFVRHCAENNTDRVLIAAVVQIARGMGKQTIAEFVENRETLEVLKRLGVDYGQGYHIGRPEPLTDHLAATSPAGRHVARGPPIIPITH